MFRAKALQHSLRSPFGCPAYGGPFLDTPKPGAALAMLAFLGVSNPRGTGGLKPTNQNESVLCLFRYL